MRPEKTGLSILRQRGYKITPQRQAIVRTIFRSRGYLTPAALYERIRREHPNIGLTTIYRTLEILADSGFICRVHVGGVSRKYIASPPQHHHHLICSGCGTVIDFTGCELGELEERLLKETGFKIESHLLEIFGHCRDCQENA